MQRVVVVGAGLAGHRAVAALHERGFTGEIVVVGDEVHRPYDRPPLSKQLLAGTFTVDECMFAPAPDGPVWRLGAAAVGLDTAARRVTLDDGGSLDYDGVVIATGRRARPWSSAETRAGIHTLRTLGDTAAFRAAAVPGARVVIVGAGFIGCEVAATLRSGGVEDVTLVDVARYPMPALGTEIGARAALLHAAHGVQLRLGGGVHSLDGAERIESVTLLDGEVLPADVVLVATGSLPNSEWLAGAGLRMAAGAVQVDRHGFALGTDGAPLHDVVAAGDIAAWPGPHGDVVCIEHWSNARDMAVIAVGNLMSDGPHTVLDLVPTFWSDQYHVKIKSAGFLRAADRFEIVAEDPDKPSLVAEAYRGDELVAAIVFNMNRTIIDYQRRLTRPMATVQPAAT